MACVCVAIVWVCVGVVLLDVSLSVGMQLFLSIDIMDTLTDLWTPCSLRMNGQLSITLLSTIERAFWIAYC